MLRTGFGTDVHFFVDSPLKKLVLAGFPIAGHRGMEADSDGDVALHALCDALSSSVGGKSMGFYVNELCENGIHSSSKYVERILENVMEAGFHVNNVAISIECITPRIDPFVDGMKANVAKILNIEPNQVGITASQGDRNDDRIRAYAIVTVVTIEKK